MDLESLRAAIPDTTFILSSAGVISDYRAGHYQQKLPPPAAATVHVTDYLDTDIAGVFQRLHREALSSGEMQTYFFVQLLPTGEVLHCGARFVAISDVDTLVFVTDLTTQKRAQEKIRRLAFYDLLTDLPNRQYFLEQLQLLFAEADKQKSKVAILYIDLDNFKRINDNLGHSYGDGVLKAVAERMSSCVRKRVPVGGRDMEPFGISRLGGDEFVCAVEHADDAENVMKVAARIQDVLREPVEFRGHEFVVTPSIGVATYPDDGESAEDLLKHADMAMYLAKDAGKNGIRNYSGTLSIRSMRRLDLENRLRKAIENDELELHYQPKINLSTQRLVGVEALVRWMPEDEDPVVPGHFIPVAEETGLIIPLGDWVLRNACQQCADWRRRIGVSVEMAVNISSQQMYQCDLGKRVMRAIFDAGINPALLQLELTESVLMRDIEETVETLNYLKSAGVTLAIDDFGTGYSSLSYLKRFPLDVLKIDRSFVKDITNNKDDAAICATIIAMAQQLSLQAIAEGIETDEQLQYLKSRGCELGQGYLLGKPGPAEVIERRLIDEYVKAPKVSRRKLRP